MPEVLEWSLNSKTKILRILLIFLLSSGLCLPQWCAVNIAHNSHFIEVIKRSSDGEMLVITNMIVVLKNFISVLSYRSKTDPVTGAVKNTKYHQL